MLQYAASRLENDQPGIQRQQFSHMHEKNKRRILSRQSTIKEYLLYFRPLTVNLDEEIHLPKYSKENWVKKDWDANESKGEKKLDLGATKIFF